MTRLTTQAYTVAWLCALPLSELVVATAMLDEEHDPLNLLAYDENSYTYGSINGHNVVIACLPPGQPGKVSASKLVQPLCQSFPNLKIHLFVGIGGGIPRIPPPDNPDDDIHLGDVVIGWADQTGAPGVVQWDLVRYLEDGSIEPLGTLDKPDRRLLNALGLVLRNRRLRKTRFMEHFQRLQNLAGFSHPGLEHDKLFKPSYHHANTPDCSSCDPAQLVKRPPRVNQDLIFHQGTIVSGDTVMRNPERRDKISQRFYGALCFEMDAAGVMDDKRCLIIRGIADYADSHKNGLWQDYAAGTAAIFAREFLFTIQPQAVNEIESAASLNFNISRNLTTTTSTAKVHFMVPFQKNGDLIGREEFIQSLETKLCVPNKHCRVALVGLGGIGKTRIALEYAFKHKKSDSVSVFWVHASTANRMEKAYQEIAKEARLVGAEDPQIDQLQLVKLWLEGENSGKWLMVIDNADDESLFFEDQNRGQRSFNSLSKMARYFPQRSNGSILLTTRNRILGVKFAKVRGVITIPKMSVSESKGLLVENLEEGDYDNHELTDLVEALENLPLALVQAAAFIAERSLLIGEYLRMYRGSDSSRIKLLSKNFEDNERDPESKNPVAVTWAISFEQIRKNDYRAAELLSIMSILDRQAIPKSLIQLDMEEMEFEEALGTLKAFSLITVEQSRQVFSLHRLVYLATRNWLDINKELDIWTEKSLILLSKHFPFPEFENQGTWMAYLPHAHTVLNSDYLPASENIAQAMLQYNVSWALCEKGDYDAAAMMAQKCLNLRMEVLGEKDLETLDSFGTLGIMLRRQGRNKEAEEIHRQVLDVHRQVLDDFEELGNEDLLKLRCVNNLALVLDGNQDTYKEAEKLHRRALSGYEKILGEEHPNTLSSVNDLGLLLERQGQFEEAEKLHRRALSSRERIQGEKHPDTLLSVSNLGAVLERQGQFEEAEKLHRRTLSSRERILGEEHPDTLSSVNNLGLVLENQGQFEEAENLHRRALSGREKTLGEEHPDTLQSVWGLAYLLAKRRQYQTASQLFQRARAGLTKRLGSDHPHTLKCDRHYSYLLEEKKWNSETENASDIEEE